MSSTHRTRWQVLATVVAVVGTAVALAVILYIVWYPTTLHPNIVLSNAEYTTAACVPYGTTGYANRYDWTFTLTNSGLADGLASVRFGLGEYGLFKSYFVPRGSQIQATGLFYGAVHPVPTECTGPEDPNVSLASFSRVPPIDNQAFLGTFVRAVSTVGFTALLLVVFAVALRRRGRSLWSDWWGLPAVVLASLLVIAGGLFSNVVVAVVHNSYNMPGVDWPLALVVGIVYTAVGLLVVYLAFRLALQHAPNRPLSVTRPPGDSQRPDS